MDLTKRQQEIFDFIRKYSAKYGYPPTVRDIGKAVGLASSSTVHAHLANLEKIGLLRRDPSKPRAIELLDRAVGSAVDSVRVRSCARTACRCWARLLLGSRCWRRRTSRTMSRCPSSRAARDGEYLLRIRGDSMKDAGILEGDLVVVRPQDTAQRRRDRRGAAGRGGHRQALLPRVRPHPPAARERDDGADPQQGGQGARARGGVCSGRSEEYASRQRPDLHSLGNACDPDSTRRVSVGARRARPFTARAAALRCPCRSSSRGGITFEESPDIKGQGGRDIDPGKPAGKCHRNKPPTSAVPRERRAGKGEMVR